MCVLLARRKAAAITGGILGKMSNVMERETPSTLLTRIAHC